MLLFEPIRIRSTEFKNRFVFLPMATHLATGDGFVGERQFDYYVERARGGVGFITLGGIQVSPDGRTGQNLLWLYGDDYIPALRRLVDAVHEHGAKITAQLCHGGRECSPKTTGVQAVAPSAIAPAMRRLTDKATADLPRELAMEEVGLIIEQFVSTAVRAKQAGMDGVEVLCSHRLLPAQFLMSDSNQRQDRYGGCFENRARFSCEMVAKIRERLGEDFLISCRIPADEYPEGGYTKKEREIFIKLLQNAGADVLSATVVVSRTLVNILPMAFPRGALVYLAEEVKGVTNLPVICGGRINDPLLAEKILQEKKADFVGMGRALVADPELPRKALEGRFDDIRRCIACNQGCAKTVYGPESIRCTINAEVGRERELRIEAVQKPKRILVVGGGPGGMEAARVARLRGHEVILCEKQKELGGQLLLAKIPPHKGEIDNYLEYIKGQLEKSGVNIRLGEEVTPELVEELKPDEVVIATGATPLLPDIPGIEAENVLLAQDVLLGKDTGERVAVVGGGLIGVETAEFLAEQAKQVTVVEMLDRVVPDLEPIARMFLMQRLRKNNVQVLTRTRVEKIEVGGVAVESDGARRIIPADSVVIAVGMKPNRGLARYLEGKIRNHIIGDALEARKILEAVHEGSLLARRL